nr:Gag-Pol polyprotein [Tanacetum cinerariifolium]
MTTPNVTSSTDSQMHNNIMEAGSRDRPPMLAAGRYPQWLQAVEANDDSPAIPEYTTPRKCGKLLKGYSKPEWSRFVTIVKQQHKLDEVAYHKLFDILKQYQNEVNELCAERLARNANPLALFRNQRTVNVAGAREKVGSPVVQQSGIQCFNCKEYGHFAKECRKPKRVKDSAYHKEKMLLYKQAKQETDDSNVIPDSPNMCEDDIQNEQNDVESDDERVALANLKLDVDENKKIQKKLKKANTSLAQELKECKAIRAETILGKPAPFSNSLERIYFPKTKSVSKANVSEGLSKPVTAQTLPQTARQAMSNTNVLKTGMYRIDNRTAHTRAPQLPQIVKNTNPRVSTSTGINHNTNVSRPQLKSNQSRDKVLQNNSQVKVKKTQVEVHPMIPSVLNKMKSVTAYADVPSQQELDLLFGPLYDEFFNVGSNPSTNIQSTSAPSTHTNVHAEENTDDQAEEGEQLQDDEFTTPFYHPLEHVRRNPSRPVQTRRQLATDPEMCMYALTVSTAEPKNIKEAMADSAWIEAMQEELHQFDRLQVWELVEKPFSKTVIKLKWLWKNKKDEDQTVIHNKA